jgi:oxygen-independent coproporphyrinogen-3 oxidase
MGIFSVDSSLLQRYNYPAPRYTSYPAATQFQQGFSAADLRRHLERSNQAPTARDVSVYLHIPFCSSPCFYCGCNRVITRDAAKGRRYAERLMREIEMMGALTRRDREVVQVHFGGGTPNFLAADEIEMLMASLARHFRLSTDAQRDFSIELDPRFVQPVDIARYAAMGLNRASLGVQDFDPSVQHAINRVQSEEQTRAVIETCRLYGFRSLNIDLIYGLPRQTIAGFDRTLDTVIEMRPDRIAIYSYAHMPHLFKAQRQIDAHDLPDPITKLALLQLAIERLSGAGYVYIGMDHFALPEDELVQAQAAGSLHRNFMGYTTHAACDLIGLGVSAISHIGDSFSQNPRELPPWERAVDEGRLPIWRGLELSEDDVIRGAAIQSLMCQGSIDIAQFEQRFELDFRRYFEDALVRLQSLAADGLVTLTDQRIAATTQGRLLLRIIATCFDRYLNEATSAPVPRFSRAI